MEAWFVQPGNIFGSNTYRGDDKLPYRGQTSILLAILLIQHRALLFCLMEVIYIWRDDGSDRKWGAI